MCHSSDYWSFRSRRQQTAEPVNRSVTPAPNEPASKPAAEQREDERTRREKELERVP